MRRTRALGATTLALCFATAAVPGAGVGAAPPPAWLVLRPGTAARVDQAPWPDADEPEAALTASAASLARDFTADFTRPDDIFYEPVGVRVIVVRVAPGARVAEVRAARGTWRAFAPVDRLVPEIPPGTALRVAGGFEGYADFYAGLDTPKRRAGTIPTGTPLRALAMGAAPPDPETGDLVRVEVRVAGAPGTGRTGWLVAGFTGLPEHAVPAGDGEDARACKCRIVRFEGGAAGTWGALHHSR